MRLRNYSWIIGLLVWSACTSEPKPNGADSSVEKDTAELSVDEKIQASRKLREGQLNMTSAVRYASSAKPYARWGEMAMMSKYGKPAHNFGYSLLAPTNEQLLKMDQGFLQILCDESNRDLLDKMMGYYLVVTDIEFAGLEKVMEVELANGSKLKVDASTKKIGDFQLMPIDVATNSGHLIQIENLPYFPEEELEKRYLKRKGTK